MARTAKNTPVDIWNVNRTCKFTVPGMGEFEAEFPDTDTETAIETATAKRLGFAPIGSLPEDAAALAYMVTHLNHVLHRVPPNFPTRPPDLNLGRLPAPDAVLAIWNGYRPKLTEYRELLKKNWRSDTGLAAPDAPQSPELFPVNPAKPAATVQRES